MSLEVIMGLTNYPNGIFATPNVGGEDFAGWFGTDVFYVDGDDGNDDNDGSMSHPFKTIQNGINSASSQDTIYIRVKAPDADASEPGTYVEDLSIPYGKHGLKLIGASQNYGVWGGPKIKNASATDLLDIKASNVHIANLQFNCTRNSGTLGIHLDGNSGYTTAAGSVGTVIQNCMFKNSSASYGAINITGGYGSVIRDCSFYNAVRGVWISSGTLPCNNHRIINCDFLSNNGAAIAEHIVIAAGLHVDWTIRDCTFGLATNPIEIGDNTTGVIANCYFNNGSSGMTAASAGDILLGSANDEVGISGCYGGDGTLLDAPGS
jgi:hypothetical protein